jgi:DNA-binding transcriptional LysR family regulator
MRKKRTCGDMLGIQNTPYKIENVELLFIFESPIWTIVLATHAMADLNWNQLKAFLETAEAGSLSAAARKLGLSQPTLSRQVAGMEAQLAVTLFERVNNAMVPTATGLALLEHARAMGAAASDFERVATGRSEAVSGVVTVSASHPIAAYLMPSVLMRLQPLAPDLRVEIVATDALSDLQRREADIAVRHVRPEQSDLIGRFIRDVSAGFYASRAYVRQRGHPKTVQDAARHRWVGMAADGRYSSYLKAHGIEIGEANFSCYSENSLTSWALMRAGLGIAPLMDEVGAQFDDCVRVLDEVAPVMFPMWLVTHRELRTARRIRLVFDVLADALAEPKAWRGAP